MGKVGQKCGRLLSLRNQSSMSKIDAFDRYSVIRNFFRQAHTTTTVRVGMQARRVEVASGRSFIRWRVDIGPVTKFGCRTFQCSCGKQHARQHYHDDSKSGESATSKPGHDDPGGELPPPEAPHNLQNYSAFFRRLALSLPHPHRPTKDDFLNVATGFWERLRIRFKWFTIKSFRRFNADDMSAFVTWFLMSQALWIFVGT